MTNPREVSDEINEDLSSDELKSVSGGALVSSPLGKTGVNSVM